MDDNTINRSNYSQYPSSEPKHQISKHIKSDYETVSRTGCSAIATLIKAFNLGNDQLSSHHVTSPKLSDARGKFKNVKQMASKFLDLKPSPQESGPKIEPRSTRLFALNAEGRFEKMSRKAPSSVKIPEQTEKNVIKWLDQHANDLSRNPNRVPYSKEEISTALKAFQDECGCSWKKMKSKWGDQLAWMQIINDVRAMQIQKISSTLHQEFPGLEILDFGSDKLTSDRDLSLSIKGNKEQESAAVERYNQLFEQEGWGETGAFIFDNNAYTQLYIEMLNTVDHQKEQEELQQVMSVVMFVRNAGNGKWETLKTAILKEADPAQHKELNRFFINVESLVYQLNSEHQQQIVKLGIEASPQDHSRGYLSELAKQIERRTPQLAVPTDNFLHDKYKKAISTAISQRSDLNIQIRSMKKKDATPEMRLKCYQQSLAVVEKFIDQQILRLQEQHAVLIKEGSRIGGVNPKESAALNPKKIKSQISFLQQKKQTIKQKELPNAVQFAETIQAWDAYHLELLEANKQLQELDKLPLTIKILNQQKEKLATSAGTDSVKLNKLENVKEQLKEAIQRQANKEHLKIKAQAQFKKAMELKKTFRQGDVDRLEELLEMGDKMQIAVEVYSMKAQCFAQEAHVTAGAFGFVVQDIQGNSTAIRHLGEYVQAMNELMGFYHAHQHHAETPHGKMIEVSKYVGPRLMEGYARMEELAKSLEIPFFRREKVENITGFFNELLALRGGSIDFQTLKNGLEQVEDDDIQKLKTDLLLCKSKSQAMEVLKKNQIPEKINLIDRYFTLTDKGGVPDQQQEKLVKEIGQRYQLPFDDQGEIDTLAIDKLMNGMQAKMIAWISQLSPEKILMIRPS